MHILKHDCADNTIATQECILLANFNHFLSELGTQPVTISIHSLIDSMIEAYLGCCGASKQFESFAWPKSPHFRAELEDFIFTRECWSYHSGCLPAVKATFQTTQTRHSRSESQITIRYAWNPPTIDFIDLQNVFQEHHPVVLAPTLSHTVGQARSGDTTTEVEYETDMPSNIGWNMMTRRLEGKWPSSLAGTAGAERLESFTLPLGVAATLTTSFPGDVKLERILRVTVPVTIKRKADDCSSLPTVVPSPATTNKCGLSSSDPIARVNGKLLRQMRRDSAISLPKPEATLSVHATCSESLHKRSLTTITGSSTTTPTSSPKVFAAREQHSSPISYKVLTELLARKAKDGASATSPLELNPLSMVLIWDATAPSRDTRDIQCWGVSVEGKSPNDKDRASLRAIASLCTRSAVAGAVACIEDDEIFSDRAEYCLSPSQNVSKTKNDLDFALWSEDVTKGSPTGKKKTKICPQVPRRLPFRCISGNEQSTMPGTVQMYVHDGSIPVEKCQACRDVRKASVVTESSDPISPINLDKRRDSFELIPDTVLKIDENRDLAIASKDIPTELLTNIRAEGSGWETFPCDSAAEDNGSESFQPVRPRRLESWREAPESLNEAEVDELQKAIQASYRECEGREKVNLRAESPIDGYESGDEEDFGE